MSTAVLKHTIPTTCLFISRYIVIVALKGGRTLPIKWPLNELNKEGGTRQIDMSFSRACATQTNSGN